MELADIASEFYGGNNRTYVELKGPKTEMEEMAGRSNNRTYVELK